ncbi:MAG: HYR domain-containing protein [Saprospiraceae bacterium]|nr:HYR domain-containing protein [Saprospiraceae bacterium]MCF8250966.1 HYR domain-containing protein [Saprospiraceae bacterium]MCF8280295.1 HYR domain-containing protein [Bacteroidales bacterium]MCF8312822.1 HYR domain-containing protein [Saprospiraceae bacterium]MCF8441269.1 HYR domain-containing protein [Saprospiraceae bacterium]
MFRFTSTLPTGWAQFASQRFCNSFYQLAMALLLLLLPQFVTGQCTTLICAQNVQFSLDNNCSGSVNPLSMLTNYWSCQGPLTLTYYDAGGNNLGPTLNSAQLGQTVDVFVKHTWTGLTCWGTVYVKDGKKPTIGAANLTLNCTEDTSATALDPPIVADNCSPASNITLSHQDTVLDFGCGYTGFAGYFDPSNWNICLTNNGDGGVDVTGAPNSVLVEGANSSPISNTSSYVTRFKIVIPTEGYVSFDWSSFGGSSFTNEGFYLTINNWCIRLSSDTLQSGTYTTGLLQPGDVLSFEQTSNGGANANSTIISNFHFSTLAWKVIQRKWTATDEWGNTATKVQTITLTRTQLSQVHFPPNRDGVEAPMLPCGSNASDPSVTGSPFIDEDGDLSTTADQFAVDNGDCFFNLTHTDQVVPTCGGSVLILRKWTVIDDCTGNFVEHTQLIKLFDITPPTITCPPPATVSTDDFGCFGIINLPSATAVDDCSSTINIEPTWAFGNGFGPFADVAQGAHTVTYHASDACGNTSSCTTTITVEDQVAPTVICQSFTVASVTTTGEATVYANLLDAGSYDHCCIESYEVKRANQPNSAFAPSVVVSCADLPASDVVVTLRVMDCHGNSNTCDVTVNVHDELPPIVVPPADVVVDCNTDLSNLATFGTATVTDNCSFTLNETTTTDITSCGQGMVTRVFTATDPSGNSTSAQQVIHLVNQTPWNSAGNQIIWPTNYQSVACSGESLEPFDLPYLFNGPTLLGQNGCEQVAVNYEDEIFWIAEPACYKIERTWTILDWCQYQANSGTNVGMWTHIQLIEVTDNQAPVFVNTPTNIMASSGAGCTSNVNIPLPQITDCSNHVTITASGALGSGFSFQNVPAGVYPMIFHASDGCGNSSEFNFTVSVGDTGAPTAYCLSGVNVELNTQGEASLAAQQLNFNSFDNCAPASSLQFSFSQNTADNTLQFNCGDVGTNLVQLWVTDPGGNSDFCETTVNVQDNLSACGANIDLGGMIQTPAGVPVGQVSVNISGAFMPTQTTLAGVGSYSFNDLPVGGDFTITPTKNIGQSNGVTAFDLVKINDHILAVNPFMEAWQVIAADANGSGAVTASDLVAIQAVILNVVPNFPNGTPSWRFVPTSHAFSNPANPWPFPQEASMNNVVHDEMAINFTGIKTGDVTGNANPAFIVGGSSGGSVQSVTEGRSGGNFLIKAKNQDLRKGQFFEVYFELEAATAWQFTLVLNPQMIEFQDFVKNAGEAPNPIFNASRRREGLVSMLYFGKQPLTHFTLKIKALADVNLADVLQINSEITPAAAWNAAEEQLSPMLEFEEAAGIDDSAASLECHPNPFGEQAVVMFSLPEPCEVRFSVLDAAGKLLFSSNGLYEKGQNKLVLRSNDLATTGLVFIKMETTGRVLTKKLVVLP